MDLDRLLTERGHVRLQLFLQKLDAVALLQVKVHDSRLVEGVEVSQRVVIRQLQIMHRCTPLTAGARLTAARRAQLSNQSVSGPMQILL